jgi:hypothetical protein
MGIGAGLDGLQFFQPPETVDVSYV